MNYNLPEMLADAFEMTRNERHRCAAIFTKPNCIWCDRAKAMLIGNDYAVREFSVIDLPEQQRDAFILRFKTVPQVIIAGTVIGGFAELHDFFHTAAAADDRLYRVQGVWS